MYHEVGEGPSEFYIPPEVFARQMDQLVEQGDQTISFAHLLAAFEDAAPLPPRPVLLTFEYSA